MHFIPVLASLCGKLLMDFEAVTQFVELSLQPTGSLQAAGDALLMYDLF